MRSIEEPAFADRPVDVVFCDIDDTLTDHGRLRAPAYDRLWALEASGVAVVPVTGRPAGWCDMIARQWPVYGVVGENGALFYRYDGATRRMQRDYASTPEERHGSRLEAIRVAVLDRVPRARVASDQHFRIHDLAIDFAEDVGPLDRTEVEHIVAVFEAHGARAKVSSIHVNGWIGAWDKLTMIQRVQEHLPGHAIYVGDSPNDQPAFAAFDRSVGVANVFDFDWAPGEGPKYVTRSRGGAGFTELADRVVALNQNLRLGSSPR